MFFWPLNFQAHHHQLKRLCPPASWTSADRRCRRRASSWRWWWGGPACGGGRPSAPGLSAGRGGRGRGGEGPVIIGCLASALWDTRRDRFLLVGRGGRRPCDQKRSASPPGNTSSNSYCQSVDIWRIQQSPITTISSIFFFISYSRGAALQNYNKEDCVFSPLFEASCLKSWRFVEPSTFECEQKKKKKKKSDV